MAITAKRYSQTMANRPTTPHAAYSDFSHIVSSAPGVGHTRFAVSLREDDAEAVLNKILPLAKVVHGVKVERTIRPEVKKEEKICIRPECVARRDIFQEIHSENDQIRSQLKVTEARVAASKNKVALTEKSISIAEEKNETLRNQIEDAQSRIIQLESEVEKADGQNQILRNQLASLQQAIESLKVQTEKHERNTNMLFDDTGPRVIFQSAGSRRDFAGAAEVSCLRFEDDDSDDDFQSS